MKHGGHHFDAPVVPPFVYTFTSFEAPGAFYITAAWIGDPSPGQLRIQDRIRAEPWGEDLDEVLSGDATEWEWWTAGEDGDDIQARVRAETVLGEPLGDWYYSEVIHIVG
jgi:hypothetical protein